MACHPLAEVPISFTPGQWELELAFADGRIVRFPFVVTADVEAPPIELRVPR